MSKTKYLLSTWGQIGSLQARVDGYDSMVCTHCANYGITLHTTYQIRSDATIVNTVVKGLGAAISPRLAAEPIPPNVQVYSLPVPLFRVISVAVLTEPLLTPAAFAFLELLKQAMSVKISIQ